MRNSPPIADDARVRRRRTAHPGREHQPLLAGKVEDGGDLGVDPVLDERARCDVCRFGTEQQPTQPNAVAPDVAQRSAAERRLPADVAGSASGEVELGLMISRTRPSRASWLRSSSVCGMEREDERLPQQRAGRDGGEQASGVGRVDAQRLLAQHGTPGGHRA